MTIKVMVQDSIISDLFEVSFNDNQLNGLLKYIERVPTFEWVDGKMIETGSRFVMTHTNMFKLIGEMAL